MKAKYFVLLGLFAGITSCMRNKSSKSNSGDAALENTIKKAESRKETDPDASGGNKCLLGYQDKYGQVLSEADVRVATGFSKNVMEIKNNNILKNPEYHSFEYRFNNKRIRKKAGITKGLALPDVVKISNVKAISLSAFESTYSAISDEQMKVAKDELNDASELKSADAEANAAVRRATGKNVSKEQVKDIGGGIMDAIKEVSKGYRVVDNLGDAARWNIVSDELYVLQNGVQFVILCDINDDKEKNKSVAIELARQVLNKCR